MNNQYYKNDTQNLIPETRKYFRDFWNSDRRNLYHSYYKEYRFGFTSPYGYFYRSEEIRQILIDIYINLSETFGNVTIPGEFSSAFSLVFAWYKFRMYLKSTDKIFQDIEDYYYINPQKIENEFDEMFAEELGQPYDDIKQMKEDVTQVLDYILGLNEISLIVKDVEVKLKSRKRR